MRMNFRPLPFQLILAAALSCLSSSSLLAMDEVPESAASAAAIEHFEKKIRPLLSARCYSCHSAKAKTVHGGLLLDSAAGIAKGGDSGPAISPKTPDESLLLTVLEYSDDDIQMPPKGKLPDDEIALLTDWVRRGAVFPKSDDAVMLMDDGIDFDEGRKFWSFQPAHEQPLPDVRHKTWPAQRMDHFLLAAMEQNDLQPSPEAGKATLLRRLSFDLTGLPPAPEDVEAFLLDSRPDAYERQVDRLLQSPQFGERWARFWLDLARYTDKTASWLDSTGDAHLYRDWIVQAMNADMPYDEFVKRQLATDMMPSTGPEDLPALGFLGLSPNYWKELKLPCEIIKVIVADEWEERVDAVTRTYLGLTVACARCHDHKFDPISTEDYYALAGIFASCRIAGRPTIEEELYEPVKEAKSKVEGLQKTLASLKKKKPVPTEKINELTQQIKTIEASTPYYNTPVATVVVEESLHVVRAGKRADEGSTLDYRPEPQDLNLFIRGNPNRLGDVVPRRFLTVLSPSTSSPQRFNNGSGRLELAEAITSDAASLTARVIVNRIWGRYLGQGLVTTPSNFGQLGARPSHPELLDDMAARFINNGWSLKTLHREIVLSATYRQSSNPDAADMNVDPDNRLLSRMPRRRLDYEQWRDAMLLSSGQLDQTLGGPAVTLDDNNNHRRTLYATVHRRDMSNVLLSHDFPDPTSHSPMRQQTTTALQGLYALNGPLLSHQADALASRLISDCETDDARIDRAYHLLFSRPPTNRERLLGLEFLQDTGEPPDGESAAGAQAADAWPKYAHVLLMSNEFAYVD